MPSPNNNMFKFDGSSANFLRNFESIANNSLANLNALQGDNFNRQSKSIADQLNAMGVSPESGVYGAALGELGGQHQLQSANLFRDLQSQLLGQRNQELSRLFDEDSFGKQFGLAQQKFAVDQDQFNRNYALDEQRLKQEMALKQQEMDQQKKANKRNLFKDIAGAGVDLFKFLF